jgi:DNA-binding protein Fis
MKQTMNIDDIKDMLYDYLSSHLEGNNNYRAHLELYEVPLIKAGLQKYGSQLQLSQALGINRNTLRKKIHEHHID